MIAAQDIVLILDEIERNPDTRGLLLFGGDIVDEFARRGLVRRDSHADLTKLINELLRDGQLELEPPQRLGRVGRDLSDNELFNARNIRLTAAGRREARDVKAEEAGRQAGAAGAVAGVSAQEAPNSESGSGADPRSSAQGLRRLAGEIDDPVRRYAEVLAWKPRARRAVIGALGQEAPLARDFETLMSELVLPDPALAESWDLHEFRGRFEEARGVLLAVAEEIEAAPRGMCLDLHPVIRGAAAQHFATDPSAAVREAARAVEIMLRTKVGTQTGTLSQVAGEAFSSQPPRDERRRLRFGAGEVADERWTNLHQGTLQFAQGCALRIRNLRQHHDEKLPPSIALEELAALSLLARWIDDARVLEEEHRSIPLPRPGPASKSDKARTNPPAPPPLQVGRRSGAQGKPECLRITAVVSNSGTSVLHDVVVQALIDGLPVGGPGRSDLLRPGDHSDVRLDIPRRYVESIDPERLIGVLTIEARAGEFSAQWASEVEHPASAG